MIKRGDSSQLEQLRVEIQNLKLGNPTILSFEMFGEVKRVWPIAKQTRNTVLSTPTSIGDPKPSSKKASKYCLFYEFYKIL